MTYHGDPGRVVVVSAHLDDAVLSAWSLLRSAAAPTVATCFTGTPPNADDALAAYLESRRQEDRAALAMCGAAAVHQGLLDSPHRGGGSVVAQLSDRLQDVVADADTVAAPVGLGRHPDHRDARDATLHCLRAAAPRQLLLYADVPYACRYGWPRWVHPQGTASVWDRVGWAPDCATLSWMRSAATSWRGFPWRSPTVVTLTPHDQLEKLAAIRCYQTQADFLGYADGGASARPDRIGHEVYWRRAVGWRERPSAPS